MLRGCAAGGPWRREACSGRRRRTCPPRPSTGSPRRRWASRASPARAWVRPAARPAPLRAGMLGGARGHGAMGAGMARWARAEAASAAAAVLRLVLPAGSGQHGPRGDAGHAHADACTRACWLAPASAPAGPVGRPGAARALRASPLQLRATPAVRQQRPSLGGEAPTRSTCARPRPGPMPRAGPRRPAAAAAAAQEPERDRAVRRRPGRGGGPGMRGGAQRVCRVRGRAQPAADRGRQPPARLRLQGPRRALGAAGARAALGPASAPAPAPPRRLRAPRRGEPVPPGLRACARRPGRAARAVRISAFARVRAAALHACRLLMSPLGHGRLQQGVARHAGAQHLPDVFGAAKRWTGHASHA